MIFWNPMAVSGNSHPKVHSAVFCVLAQSGDSFTSGNFLFEEDLKLIVQCFQIFTFPGKMKRFQRKAAMVPSS